jgi:transaldolase
MYTKDGIKKNVTLKYLRKHLVHVRSMFVSLFLGRLDDTGYNEFKLNQSIRSNFDIHGLPT